jgi:5'-3' exonuclease
MGIKSLSKYLRDNYGNVFKHIHLSEFRYKKIAIDISLYMCNYKVLYDEDWLKAFVKLVSCLRENEIHCVFIYDTGYPPEKEAEKKKRIEDRKKIEEKIHRIEEAIEFYHSSGEISQELIDFQTKKKISIRTLSKTKGINIQGIEFELRKMKRQCFTIKPEDYATTKALFDILDVPYFHAPVEAETMCSDLCITSKVDAVLSEDTDVLAYGAPVLLTKINTANSTCIQINYDKVLKEMEMTSDQFLDFCIMCGTDYNKNIFKIGPKKAEILIKKFNSIEGVRDEGKLDVSILNHIRGRELFRGYQKSDLKISYCGFPDFVKLEDFLFKKNAMINLDSLKKSFVQNNIIFED